MVKIKKEEKEFKSTQEVKPKTVLPKVVSTPKELASQNDELRKRVESLEQEVWDLKNKLKEAGVKEEHKEETKEEEHKDEINE